MLASSMNSAAFAWDTPSIHSFLNERGMNSIERGIPNRFSCLKQRGYEDDEARRREQKWFKWFEWCKTKEGGREDMKTKGMKKTREEKRREGERKKEIELEHKLVNYNPSLR